MRNRPTDRKRRRLQVPPLPTPLPPQQSSSSPSRRAGSAEPRGAMASRADGSAPRALPRGSGPGGRGERREPPSSGERKERKKKLKKKKEHQTTENGGEESKKRISAQLPSERARRRAGRAGGGAEGAGPAGAGSDLRHLACPPAAPRCAPSGAARLSRGRRAVPRGCALPVFPQQNRLGGLPPPFSCEGLPRPSCPVDHRRGICPLRSPFATARSLRRSCLTAFL